MSIKVRNTNNKLAIENIANELADRPYGTHVEDNTISRASITLPSSILYKLEDMAKDNKRRNKEDLRSVSAIIRYCIKQTLHI